MEYISGNIFIRPMEFTAPGQATTGHSHTFDHTHYVTRGGLRIQALNDDGTVRSAVDKYATDLRNWVLIKAGVRHNTISLPPKIDATPLMIEAGMRAVPGLTAEQAQAAFAAMQSLDLRAHGHCIYSHRNPQGEIVQTWDGWAPGIE